MSNQTPRYVKCCKVHPSNWDYDRVFRLLIVSPKSQDHGYWNLAGLSLAKWKLTALSIVFSHRTLEYIQSHMIQSSSLIKCKRSTLRSKLSIVRCFFLLWCDWWFSIVIFFAIIIIHNRLLSVDNSTQCLHKHNITSLIGIRILWMSQTTNFLFFFFVKQLINGYHYIIVWEKFFNIFPHSMTRIHEIHWLASNFIWRILCDVF